MQEKEKEQCVLECIKNFRAPFHLKSLLLTAPYRGGFLGSFCYFELATYRDGHTHIGVRDVFNILGDEKEYLCRCNNKVLRSVLSQVDTLVSKGLVTFTNSNFQDQTNLQFTDVGMLDDDVQNLYDKYIMGFLQ